MEAAPRLIIPGLPNHIALLCLVKVPRIYHACLASVCIAWRNAVHSAEFYQERRRLGSTDAWLVLVSAEILSTPLLLYSAYDLSTRQLLFKVKFPPSVAPGEGDCTGYAHSLLNSLDHYRIVAMNEYIALLGFSQSSGLRAAICTFTIYNTVTNERRHTRPPRICREMFACGVIEGRLYVVGGWNERGEMERTTEVYDFEADRWGTAEELPEGVGRIEADVVYQGKLYVQCWEGGEEGKCVLWVYNPGEDRWRELCGKSVRGQQLIATDNFMYAIGPHGELSRFESSAGNWKPVGRRRPSKLPAAADSKRLRGHVSIQNSCQGAFGNKDDIFLLQETNGTLPCGLLRDGVTRWHRLLSVKPSLYQAGAVVNT